jgi:hypothetical protein
MWQATSKTSQVNGPVARDSSKMFFWWQTTFVPLMALFISFFFKKKKKIWPQDGLEVETPPAPQGLDSSEPKGKFGVNAGSH